MKYRSVNLLIVFYVLCQQGGSDIVKLTYDVDSSATVDSIMATKAAGRPDFVYKIVDKTTYDGVVTPTPSVPQTQADYLTQLRTQADAQIISGIQPANKVQRAVYLVARDEINLLRQRDVDRSVDVAASTSLADLKTRWAARAALDDRTLSQFLNAVQNKIDSGAAD